MKFGHNNKYTTICLYAFFTFAACVCFYVLVDRFAFVVEKAGEFLGVISPFIYGFIIAYLLSPTEEKLAKLYRKLFEKARMWALNKNRKKSADSKDFSKACEVKVGEGNVRVLSVVSTYIVFIVLIGIVFRILVPQLILSISEMGANFSAYTESAIVWLENFLEYFNIDNLSFVGEKLFGLSMADIEAFLDGVMNVFDKYSPKVISFLENFLKEFLNFFIGIIISVYMLASKKKFASQIKKLLYALLPKNAVVKLCSLANEADESFGKYIGGQIVDSVVVGVVWFLIASFIGFPYPFLISVIIGITNIIPFFGPFIGGIPAAIIVFLAKPQMTLLFVILLVVVQQLDGNLLAPRIIGKSTGVSPFWVIFSILVMGEYFGIAGLVIAVPLFSLVYKELKVFFEARLTQKGLPTQTENYLDFCADIEPDDTL